MLKRIINSAVVKFTIIPIDPLLIKSGQATVGGVDMTFVQTYRFGEQPEPFIPGSSLKGVLRSYAEKICRSLRDNLVPVCLPYVDLGNEQAGEHGQASCGSRIKSHLAKTDQKSLPTSEIYRVSCPACRMFGSHYFIGRLATSDGYLTESCKKNGGHVLETRDGVAIDRLTGGPAGGAKFNLDVLVKGEFGTMIELQNFERWQLGLLGLVLRDLENGLIRIGMGKSRGLGRIKATLDSFIVTYYGKPQQTLVGLEQLCAQAEKTAYDFYPESPDHPKLPQGQTQGLHHLYDLTTTWKTLLEPAVTDLTSYIAKVTYPTSFTTL